jgi:hypothetical protein
MNWARRRSLIFGLSRFQPKGAAMPPDQPPSRPKVRATLYLPHDVLEEARNATVHLAGYPVHLTLTKLAEDALRNELARLKHRHNGGRDFPPRPEDLRGGRPIAA